MNEKPTTERRSLLHWVTPSYDEVALLSMSVTSVALLVVDSGLRRQIADAFAAPAPPGPGYFLIWAVAILGGSALSVFHAFSSRPKSLLERTWMGVFATTTNGIAGIVCGVELLDGQWKWGAIFPLWNIASGVVLLYLMGLAPQDAVSDENATRPEIALGLAVLACVFSYCRAAHLSWAMTFSVCVAYATSFERPLRKVLWSRARRAATT